MLVYQNEGEHTYYCSYIFLFGFRQQSETFTENLLWCSDEDDLISFLINSQYNLMT